MTTTDRTQEEPTGILTPTQRRFLCDDTPDNDGASSTEMFQQIRNRVAAATLDFEVLYCGLRDEDIDAIFDDQADCTAPAPFHDALVFLFYCMMRTDQQLEPRIERAVKHAYAATDQHATTRLDIVTEPFLPQQQRLKAVATDGLDRVSFEALERLFYDESLPPEAFSEVANEQWAIPSADEIREMRDQTAKLERIPLSVVLDVEITTVDSSDGGWRR